MWTSPTALQLWAAERSTEWDRYLQQQVWLKAAREAASGRRQAANQTRAASDPPVPASVWLQVWRQVRATLQGLRPLSGTAGNPMGTVSSPACCPS